MGITKIDLGAQATAKSDVDLNSHKIVGLATPTEASHAATKAYVDAISAGLDVKESCVCASTANVVIASALEAGDVIDGVTLVEGDRVLLKDQTAGEENGIYVAVAAAAGVASRSTDADEDAEVTQGMFVFVAEGTANGGNGWMLTTDNPITVDTTALVFTQFSGAGQITAGSGLTKTGNTIDAIGGDGLTANADSLEVDIDGSTLAKSGSGLKVADAGVTETQLHTSVAGDALTGGGGSALDVAAGTSLEIDSDTIRIAEAAAGDGLTGGGAAALAVSVDDATIEIDTDALRVKDAGIDKDALNVDVAGDGIAGGAGTALSVDKVVREAPSGTINGSTVEFTLANTPVSGTEELFLNGLLQNAGGNDYTIAADTITMEVAPETGDALLCSYLK